MASIHLKPLSNVEIVLLVCSFEVQGNFCVSLDVSVKVLDLFYFELRGSRTRRKRGFMSRLLAHVEEERKQGCLATKPFLAGVVS